MEGSPPFLEGLERGRRQQLLAMEITGPCPLCGQAGQWFRFHHGLLWAVVFRGQHLDRETLTMLLARAAALRIGDVLDRAALRMLLAGYTPAEVSVGQKGGRYRGDARMVLRRLWQLLEDLWEHDGCGEWV